MNIFPKVKTLISSKSFTRFIHQEPVCVCCYVKTGYLCRLKKNKVLIADSDLLFGAR